MRKGILKEYENLKKVPEEKRHTRNSSRKMWLYLPKEARYEYLLGLSEEEGTLQIR